MLYLRCLQGSCTHIRIKKRQNICLMHTEETFSIITETLHTTKKVIKMAFFEVAHVTTN